MLILYLVLIIDTILIIYLVYREIIRNKRLCEIEELVDGFIKGELKKRLYFDKKDKISMIANSLNILAQVYEDKIYEASLQKQKLICTLISLPDAIVLLNKDYGIELVNPAFEKLFKINKKEILYKKLNEIIRVPEVIDLLEKGNKHRAFGKCECYIDKSEKYVETIVCPLQQQGYNSVEFLDIIVIFRDITNIKRTEQMRRDFVANVSHELKTPITTIKGYTETLLTGALDNKKDAVEFLNIIMSHTQRMERLIKDLIDLSKIESGALVLKKQEILVIDLIKDVLKNFEPSARKKGLYLHYNIENKNIKIKADYLCFHQILTNLIDNAIKFTNKGGVIIEVKNKVNGCNIIVKDTGIGIPEKCISRLGERFFRVDASRSRELGGTGLGLAIVKHLIKAHGWNMKIKSKEGEGTEVKILIKSKSAKF